MNQDDHLYCVILAGGGGTRLWPKSRINTPKQFLKMTGSKTMFQLTAERFAKFIPWDKVIVVTTEAYKNEIRKQVPEILKENILYEPARRDTALAMLVGTLFAMQKDPKAIVVNGAADHVVTNDKEFIRLMKAAAHVASDYKHLVAVGITPTRPATGFGYIKIGKEIPGLRNGVNVYEVANFTEKPDSARARAFLATGKYFWNANNYVWSGKALVEAFKKYMPELYHQTQGMTELSTSAFGKALPAIYEKSENISIDYAISEKADNLLLIPGDFGWNDIGEWKVVYDLGEKDPAGNVVVSHNENQETESIMIESQNNLIHTGDRVVALLGVQDMLIIDTDEILMIAPKSRSQDVKKIVQKLKAEKKDRYL